jgi:hypothetical protein
LSNSGNISGTPDTAGSSNFTITATDTNSATGSRNYSITIIDPAACTFCDDFNDGVLNSNWTYVKGTWNEMAGELIGTHLRKAETIASPIFNGCTNCSVDTSVKIGTEPEIRVSVLAWYLNNKNYVEVMLNPVKDKIILKQRVNGTVVRKGNTSAVLNPNTAYQIAVSFNGTDFSVMLDGSPVLSVPSGAPPSGTVGFRVKKGTARFDQINVN